MQIRIGTVTQVYADIGKAKVVYKDKDNASLQLSMLTYNNEYLMPLIGKRVLTLHLDGGTSKGFILGTFYGADTLPKATSGYRKDFGGTSYVTCESDEYKLKAQKIELDASNLVLKCSYGEESFENILKRIERIEDALNLPHTI